MNKLPIIADTEQYFTSCIACFFPSPHCKNWTCAVAPRSLFLHAMSLKLDLNLNQCSRADSVILNHILTCISEQRTYAWCKTTKNESSSFYNQTRRFNSLFNMSNLQQTSRMITVSVSLINAISLFVRDVNQSILTISLLYRTEPASCHNTSANYYIKSKKNICHNYEFLSHIFNFH